MNKKNLRWTILLLVTGWMLVILFAYISLRCRMQNRSLKYALFLQLQRIESLSREAESVKEEKDGIGERTLNYLKWQYVLSDQVSQASKRLSGEVTKNRDLKKNKELISLLYYNLGLCYTMAVDFNRAITAFEQAVKFQPQDAESCYNLGLLYSTYRADQKKALKYYEKYIELAPSGQKADAARERIEALKGKS